jgi:hypothetical protein
MVERIVFIAYFGSKAEVVTLSHNRWGGGSYEFKAGEISGKFHPTPVWGWMYWGDPLELDDIQILLDMIIQANNLDDDSLKYYQHVEIHKFLRRDIRTREDYYNAVEKGSIKL